MRIAAISDTHIRMKDRHEEYRAVFSTLYAKLKKDKVDRIVVAGDIVHSKITLSPELVDLTREFFINLSNIAPVDIIVGNHDMNISNFDRMDSLTPIVDSVKKNGHGVFYYKESGFYDIPKSNFVYGVFSLIDGKGARLLKKNKDPKKIYIALYHGMVEGCVLENDYVYIDTSVNIRTFANYDFGFFGDIHRHQFLNEKKSICYIGNLIQQHFGESIEKGYLLWDIESPKEYTTTFVPLENEYGFYTLYLKTEDLPNLKLPEKCKIRVILEKHPNEISKSETARIISTIYKKYNPLSVQFRFKPIEDKTSGDVEVSDDLSLTNTDVQRDLLIQWLGKKCSKSEINKIIEIDKAVSEVVVDQTYEDFKNTIWNIKNVSIENFMSYGEKCFIDLEKLKGVIGIFGENRAGKSVILDAILYALFNKTSRNVKNEDLVNKRTNNSICKVELELEVRGIDYRIERWTTRQYAKRTRKFINARTDVIFKRKYKGADKWENLSETQRNETEKIIRNSIGSFEDFLLTTLSTQNNDKVEAVEFLSLRPALRSDIILRFLGLDIFNKKYEYVNDVLRTLDRERRNYDLDERSNYLLTAEEELKKICSKISAVKKAIKENEKAYNKLMEEKNNYLSMINGEIKVEKTIDVLSKEKENIEKELEKLNDKISVLLEEKSKLGSSIEEIDNSKIRSKFDMDKLEKIYENKTKSKELGEKIEKLKIELESDKSALMIAKSSYNKISLCPVSYDDNHKTCLYLTEYEEKRTAFLNWAQKVKEKINSINEMSAQIEKYKSSSQFIEKYEELQEQIKELSVKIQSVDQEIREQEYKVEAKNLSLNLVESHLNIAMKNEEIIINNKKYESLVEKLNKELLELKNSIKESNNELLSYSNKKVILENEIKTVQIILDKIRKSDEQLTLYGIYCDAMHRTGLPVEILKSYVPKINYKMNKILSDIISFGVFFKIDEDSTDIDIVMKEDDDSDDTRPASMASGMERLLINFAIRYALICLSNLSKSSTWMIDEGFGVLSTENLYLMSRFFENVQNVFRHIIIITHIDTLKDVANWILTIEKKNGISYINKPQKNI